MNFTNTDTTITQHQYVQNGGPHLFAHRLMQCRLHCMVELSDNLNVVPRRCCAFNQCLEYFDSINYLI